MQTRKGRNLTIQFGEHVGVGLVEERACGSVNFSTSSRLYVCSVVQATPSSVFYGVVQILS